MGIQEVLAATGINTLCPVCKSVYKEPKLTPCLHNVCLNCLNNIAKKNPYSSHIECPVCQAEVEKLNGTLKGFSALPTDVYLTRLISLHSANDEDNENKCKQCGQSTKVFALCFDCGGVVYRKCSKGHSDSTHANHRIVNTEDLSDKHLEDFLLRQLCCVHKPSLGVSPVEFYCRHCNKCICRICSATAKEKHSKTSNLQEEFEDASKTLQDAIDCVTKRTGELQEGRMLIAQRLIDLDNRFEMVKREVHLSVDQLVTFLRQHEQEMFSHLDGVRNVKKENLDSQKRAFDMSLLQANNSINFAQSLLQRKVTGEVVSLKEHVDHRLRQLASMTVDSRPIETACVGYVPNKDVVRHINSSVLGSIESSNTDVMSSITSGEGLKEGAVGEEAVFTVITRNMKGETCHSTIDCLNIQVSSPTGVLHKTTTQDNENGFYEVSYLPTTPGAFQVHIEVAGKDIKGSPFQVDVRPPVLVPLKVFGSHAGVAGQFTHPHGISVSDAREIAVTDTHKNCIHVFDSKGRKLLDIGESGIGEGQLNYPAGITFDKANKCLLVADRDNHRIQIFNRKNGKLVKKFGIPGTGDGQFNRPTGVSIDKDGRIIVTDWHNHRVQVFTPDGKFVFKFGTDVSGKLKHPRDTIFHDPLQMFFVADTGNNVLKVFNKEGKFLHTIGIPGSKKGQLFSPRGLTIDRENRLIVCDFDNHRLQFFSLVDGRVLSSYGSKGANIGQFSNPLAVAILDDENIVVTDWRNDRIQVFSMGPQWKMAYLCDVMGAGAKEGDY